MTVGGHGRQTLDKGIHAPISWTFVDASARAAFTPVEGNPFLEAQLTSEDIYKIALQLSDESLWLLTAIGPTTWSPFGGLGVHALAGGAHTASTLAELNALISDAALHDSGTGGAVHANATTSVAGFMSGADKTKLDGVAAGAAALTSTAPVNVTKAAAAVGSGSEAARNDHKHDVDTAAPGATGVATASAEGSSTSLARADHVHQSNTAPVNVTKAAAVIGTSGEPARADHKHDVTTAAPAAGAVAVGNSASEGSATSLARSDHQHAVAAGTPVSVGTANAPGSAATFARSDHVHASFPTYCFYADNLDNPNTSSWVVNALANSFPVASHTALVARYFDDTTVEGVGFLMTIPAGATNITLGFKSRANSTPGGTVAVIPGLYLRSIPDNAAVGAWSSITNLTALSMPTNTNWQYDTQTLTLASLSLTAGVLYQFELVRNAASGSDTLTGDWLLLELSVGFS